MKRITLPVTVFLVITMAGAVFANPILEINLKWNNGGEWLSDFMDDDVSYLGDDTWSLQKNIQTETFDTYVSIMYDVDPSVLVNFTIQNLTQATQTYTYTFITPVSPATTGGTVHGGSVGGTLTDNGNISALANVSTVSGTAFYAGQIDGVTVLSIYDDLTEWTVPLQGGTMTIPAVNTGLPGPVIPGPDVSSNISIEHIFTLTAGDTIGITSYFEVQPIPEPATLALMSMGTFVLIKRNRRRLH